MAPGQVEKLHCSVYHGLPNGHTVAEALVRSNVSERPMWRGRLQCSRVSRFDQTAAVLNGAERGIDPGEGMRQNGPTRQESQRNAHSGAAFILSTVSCGYGCACESNNRRRGFLLEHLELERVLP